MARIPRPPAPARRDSVRNSPAKIDPTEAHRLASAGAALLLDVREAGEHAEVHAPGALLVPLTALAGLTGPTGPSGSAPGPGAGSSPVEAVRTAADGRPVLVVCRSGNRSAIAAGLLDALGVPAMNVTGGMRAWSLAGLPMHSGACRCGGAI
ncbi:rhodanese-like domain-containing protein [Kitasatospora sp. NPDC088391]|uniref:rhodanese-like domain-containing protein n=1 Tax=Kitasatospora sp. NPDC088391 TaxID=3364074 RepID=UPI00381F5F4F